MPSALETAFELDRRWHWLRAEMETSKKPDLYALARALDAAGTPWAIVGGIAVQVHQEEPRTTLDVDVAVADRASLPEAHLAAAGFAKTGDFMHSVNWVGPGGTPVQFSDDPELAAAIPRARRIPLDDITLPVMAPLDLVRAKLRAAADPGRRRSKRLQDLSDALALVERLPELAEQLTPGERRQLAG